MRLPVAILSCVAAAVLVSLPLAWLGHGLRGGHGVVTWISLSIGLSCAILAGLTCPQGNFRRPTGWGWIMIAIFAASSARAFLWIFYACDDDWKVLSPNNLGDLSLHLSFINWLASTTHWWPASPILAGDPLRYPLGSDLFNALLMVGGIPPAISLIWCGLIGSALTGYALWRWGGGVALAALLFNGGFAAIVLLKTGWGGNPQEVSEWKNLFLTVFVTQRGFLYALPAGFLLLAAWREEAFGEGKKRVLQLPVQILLLGTMPLFSIHGALYLGVAMAGMAILVPFSRRQMLKLALFSWPLMALLGWMITSGAGGPSAIHALGWQIGWLSDGSYQFWFWNFGVALPFAVILCFYLGGKKGELVARAFVWPAAFVFLACMLIRFAPWPWDNTKLMIWSWLVIAPYLWSELLVPRPPALRVLALLLLFGSGAATLLVGLDGRHGYFLVKRSSLNTASWELRTISPNAVIACAPEYNQPVLMLGHPVVCGYEGHLWSHGLDYKERLELLNKLMNGEGDWRGTARKLGASYIYWGELESKKWPDSLLPFAKETIPSLHRLE